MKKKVVTKWLYKYHFSFWLVEVDIKQSVFTKQEIYLNFKSKWNKDKSILQNMISRVIYS